MSDTSNFGQGTVDSFPAVSGTTPMNQSPLTHSQRHTLEESGEVAVETALTTVLSVTASATATAWGHHNVSAAAGSVTLTLPTGVGKVWVSATRVDSSANTVTVACGAGQTFADGSTSIVLSGQNVGGKWHYDGSSKWTVEGAQPGAYAPVFNIGAFGGSATASDNSTALSNALAAAYAAGGGSIYYPSGGGTPYKHLSQIKMPTNGATNPPLTVPIRIYGDGAPWNDAGGALTGGTQLDFRYSGRTITDLVTNGTTTVTSATANFTTADVGAFVVASGITADRAVILSVTNSTTAVLSSAALTTASGQTAVIGGAKIESTGVGILQIDNCDICNYGTDPLPLIRSTYTVMKLRCGFVGVGTGTGCVTDAWVAGGVNASDGTGTPNDGFQGYGSSMVDCGFHKIRRWALLQTWANGISIHDNLCDTTCGSSLTNGAPIEIYGVSGNACSGNSIHDNTIEETNYKVGAVKTSYGAGNVLGPNGCYDQGAGTTCHYWFDVNSTENRVVDGFRQGITPLVIDNAGRNDVLSAYYGSEYRAQTPMFKAGAYSQTVGFVSLGSDGSQGYLQVQQGNYPDTIVTINARSSSQYTDGVTNGTTTFTSATANFGGGDIGSVIYCSGNLPSGTRILEVVNSTTVILSQAATTSASGLTFYVQRAGGNGTGWTLLQLERNHIRTTGSAPTAYPEAALNGGTASVSGTDSAGTLTATTSASPTSGFIAAIAVTNAYSGQPRVVWFPANAAAAAVAADIYDQSTAANLELYTTTALAASTTYKWNYLVLQ